MSNAPSLSFGIDDGSISIGDFVLSRGTRLSDAAESLQRFSSGQKDHRNGYEWLYYKGLLLGGYPCALALCFFKLELTAVHWGIELPNAELQDGWPTREAIDEEIRVMREILSQTFDRIFAKGEETFPWGSVWSLFDAKGFQPSAGLRYSA